MKKPSKNFKNKREYKVDSIIDNIYDSNETYTKCNSNFQEKLLKDFFNKNPEIKLK